MKSLLRLTQMLTHEEGKRCGVSTNRDLGTIAARVDHEGISFLTISLPSFAEDLQKALDSGRVTSDLFAGYSRTGGLPKLFSGFLRRVFDTTGGLLDEPDIDCIRAVRQLTLLHSKVRLPCSPERVSKAYDRYIECEKEVRYYDQSFAASSSAKEVRRMGSILFGQVFNEVSEAIETFAVCPDHGPGAVADRLLWNTRWRIPSWTDRLECIFPYGEYVLPSHRYWRDGSTVPRLTPGQELPVRVITVPKTLKTPRIIAIEPTCMQYMQQGLMRCIVRAILRDPLAKGLMDPTDQSVNQYLARCGSEDGSLVTLDLREASDRVSNQFVRAMVAPWTPLKEALDATRSRRADVPGHGVVRLAKYASMGSATCFPIEAMVFTTIIFLGIQRALGRQMSRSDCESFLGTVRVFGDDIIVPKDYALAVVQELEAFGHRVNSSKSFLNGKFRESCGKDWYDGRDVSIIRNRAVFPHSRADVSELVSAVSLRNQLADAGYTETVSDLDRRIERIIPFPYVPRTSSALGRWSFDGTVQCDRMSTHTQQPQVKAAVVAGRPPIDKIEGWPALTKWFTRRGLEPLQDGHLDRAGRPDRPRITVRWVNSL